MRFFGKEKGFTLLEIIVVLVLLTLIMTLVTPMFANLSSKVSLKVSSRRVISLLEYTRSQSITKAKDYTISFVKGENLFAIKTGKEVITSGKLADGAYINRCIDQSNRETGDFTFYPDGSSTGGLIEIANENKRKFGIKVDAITGRIQVAK